MPTPALPAANPASSGSANTVYGTFHAARIGSVNDRAVVGGLSGQVCPVAPHADDQLQRQLQIVDHVPQRIAGLEQAGALDDHDRPGQAEHQPGGDADRFALAAGADQFQLGTRGESRFPRPDEAVRDPDDVREPRGGDVPDGSGGIKH